MTRETSPIERSRGGKKTASRRRRRRKRDHFETVSKVSPRGESRLYARICAYTHARITCTLERRKKRRKRRKRKKRRGGGIGDAGSRLQTTRNSHRSRDFSASMGGELPLRRPEQAARTAARMVRTTRNFLHGNRVSSDERARALPIASCGGDAAINTPIYWRGIKGGGCGGTARKHARDLVARFVGDRPVRLKKSTEKIDIVLHATRR